MSAEAAVCAECGRSGDIAVDDCGTHLDRLSAMIDAGQAAHDRGEAFAFDLRDDLGADDAPIGHSAGVVTVLLDADALTGIALSPDAARRFGVALIECAALCEHGVGEEPAAEGSAP